MTGPWIIRAVTLANLLVALLTTGCTGKDVEGGKQVDEFADQRRAMVATQMRGVTNKAVLKAMEKVQRHLFVPPSLVAQAYKDHPLSIGHEQTISQPYIVALMTEKANLSPGDRVLEIGTGSGYQAAVLAELGCQVYTIEIIPEVFAQGGKNLEQAGYVGDIQRRCGDGYKGWPTEAPFAAIIVTAAPEAIPPPLKTQLKIGGRLVIPVGEGVLGQSLVVLKKLETGFHQQKITSVRFVPLTRKKDDQ